MKIAKSNFLVNKENILETLGNTTLDDFETEFGRFGKRSQTFFYILYRVYKNKGADVRINRSDIADQVHCCKDTVTNHIKFLRDLEMITVDSQTNYINGKPITINYYNINWKGSWNRIKNIIYAMAKEVGIYNFIHKHVTRIRDLVNTMFETCTERFSPLINNLSFNKDRYIYSCISSSKNEIISSKVVISSTDSVSAPESTYGSPGIVKRATDYLNGKAKHISSKVRPLDYNYFNEDIIECPEEWREIAHSLQMKQMYVDRNFDEFREYWIGQGKIKTALKKDWTRTWKNRIEDVLQNRRTAYMKENPHYDFELLTPSKAPFFNDQQPEGSAAADSVSITLGSRYTFTKDKVIPDSWSEVYVRTKMHPDHVMDVYTKFKDWHTTGRGMSLHDSDEGWEKRWLKWLSMNTHQDYLFEPKKGSFMKESYGKATECELDLSSIPDNLKPIHHTLIHELTKPIYLSWIKPGDITKMDDGTYSIEYKNSFIRDYARSNVMIQKCFSINCIDII